MPPLSYVETMRDWSIIFMAVLTAAFFLVALILTVIIGLLIRALLKKTIYIVDDSVKPLLDTAKDTLGTAGKTIESVRGTSTYVSEAAVKPIIRVYGVLAGVRKAIAVFAGINSADTRRQR